MNGAFEQLRSAVHQWTAFAVEAERSAHRRQRSAVLDLLQAARQIALGADAVRQLAETHANHRRMVNAVAASAGGLVRRLEERAEALRPLADAAERARVTADALPANDRSAATRAGALRSEAADLLTGMVAGLGALETALADARTAAMAAGHLSTALDGIDAELGELRSRFERLGQEAAASLATLRAAGEVLATSNESYEAAQRAALDLRRDVLAPPIGAPLTGPGVPPAPLLVGVA